MGAVWDGRPKAIRPARVPGRGWARQFYNLRAGSPRGAAFSCLWKAAGLRAGQRHASVLGTVPRKEVGRPRRAREVRPRGSGYVCVFWSNFEFCCRHLLCDLRAFVV